MPEQRGQHDTSLPAHRDAEEAVRQTESHYLSLMDQMKASVPENGEFYKAFEKEGDSRRAFILNYNIGTPNKPTHVVVTGDGIKFLFTDSPDSQKRLFNLKPSEYIFGPENPEGRQKISTIEIPDVAIYSLISVSNENQEDQALINEAFGESIKEARENSTVRKAQQALEKAQKDAIAAKDITGRLSNLLVSKPQTPL